MNLKTITAGAMLLACAAAVTVIKKSSQDETATLPKAVRQPGATMASVDRINVPETNVPIVSAGSDRNVGPSNVSHLTLALETVQGAQPEDEAQSPQIQNPEGLKPARVFTAPVQARMQSGQTLVTGGWSVSPGRLAFVFVTPETDPVAGTVMTRSTILEVPEVLWRELGLQEFVSEESSSTLNHVIEGPESAVFLQALRETEGVHVVASPAVNTLDGQAGSISVGQFQGERISLGLLSVMTPDGGALDLAVTPEFTPGAAPGLANPSP